MKKDILSKFRTEFDRQKESILVSFSNLDNILEENISLDEGINKIVAKYPDITNEQIIEKYTSGELMLFSLASKIPDRIDLEKMGYFLKLKGIQFKTKRNKLDKAVKFVLPFSEFINHNVQTYKTTFDELKSEGKFIYSELIEKINKEIILKNVGKNNKLSEGEAREIIGDINGSFLRFKSQKINALELDLALNNVKNIAYVPDLSEINEVTGGDRSILNKKFLSQLLTNPDSFKSIPTSNILFMAQGILEFNIEQDSFNFHQYNLETNKKIKKSLKSFREFNKTELSTISKKHLRDMENELNKKVNLTIQNKVQNLPQNQLSSIEKKAFEMENNLGVEILASQSYSETHRAFGLPMNLPDLDNLEQFLLGIGDIRYFIDKIYKPLNPPEFSGKEKDVSNIAMERISKILAPDNIVSSQKNVGESREQFSKFSFYLDNVDFISMKKQFSKYSKALAMLVAGRVFNSCLPSKISNKYINIVKPGLESQILDMQTLGFNYASASMSLIKNQFMKDAVFYAQTDKALESQIDPHKQDLFNEIYAEIKKIKK